MKLLQLAACSLLGFLALVVSGALWFVAAMKFVVMLLPLLPPNYPIGDFYDLPNFVMLLVVMVPWAGLCAWFYWKTEGAWLNYLDPNGARLEVRRSKRIVG